MQMFERWRLPRVVASRLAYAARHLDKVAASGSYGDDDDELTETLDAITLCTDFLQIAATLPDERLREVADELAIAIRGSMSGTSKGRQPWEYLSQYWFGTALAVAHVVPHIVPQTKAEKSRPDFVVRIAGVDCAVEVKRPESFNSARDALDRAAGQLRNFELPGAAVLDLSDCIDSMTRRNGFLGDETFSPALAEQMERLMVRPLKYNQSDKYKRVFMLVLFARTHGWKPQDGELHPDGSYFVNTARFRGACDGSVVAQADGFRQAVERGFEEMSGRPAEPIS